jgi:opacity protein-like surface antigen
MHRLLALLLFVSLALIPTPALAQTTSPVSVVFFGGLQLPIGETRDAMGTGWNVGVGGGVRLAPDIGLRLDYMYSRFGAATATWEVALGPMLPAFVEREVRAKSQMHAGSLDVTWGRELRGGARGYIVAGPTLFYRRTQITTTGTQPPPVDVNGPTSACEPLWLQCPAQAVTFDRALGIKTSSDLGFNVGAGIAFRAGLTALVTIEARYYQVRREFRDTQGRSVSPSARFLPISVGLTF